MIYKLFSIYTTPEIDPSINEYLHYYSWKAPEGLISGYCPKNRYIGIYAWANKQ